VNTLNIFHKDSVGVVLRKFRMFILKFPLCTVFDQTSSYIFTARQHSLLCRALY